jgi:MFS family permease
VTQISRLFSFEPFQWKGPLATNYWSAVGLVIAALTPFLVLSAATTPLETMIGRSVHLGSAGMQMSGGLADAAYCFGTILAVQLVCKAPSRRLLLAYAGTFTVCTIVVALSHSAAPYFIGRIGQGMMTSLMLITAAPALVLGFPLPRMRSTAMVMNMGIFGAVALGPVIGGAFVSLGDWRLLFWIAAGVGLFGLTMTILTFADVPPADPKMKVDIESLGLASVGCTAAFFGASSLSNHPFVSVIVLLPMIFGLSCIVGLILHQMHVEDPIMPIKQLGHTIPVAAILLALFAGAGSVALTSLLQVTQATHGVSSAVFWPEFGGAVITAFLFGQLFFTKYVPVFAHAGLACLAVTGILIVFSNHGSVALVAIGTGGLGLGVGASVAPGLFVAGFSLPALQLPRIFALVEMLRGVAAFMTAPLIVHMAQTTGPNLESGIRDATWVCVGLLAVGFFAVLFVIVAGGVKLQDPQYASWMTGNGSAIQSTDLFAKLRGKSGQPASLKGQV